MDTVTAEEAEVSMTDVAEEGVEEEVDEVEGEEAEEVLEEVTAHIKWNLHLVFHSLL